MQQKKEYYTLTVILMMLRSKGFAAWKYTQKRWDMDTKLQLVRQAKQGNAQSFAVLYQNIYYNLYRFALYTLGNPADAEDAVSDAVADAWATIGKLRKEESFESWMFQILHNKCRRKRKEYFYKPLEWTDALEGSTDESSLDEKYHLRSLFGKLAAKDRAIISLRIHHSAR